MFDQYVSKRGITVAINRTLNRLIYYLYLLFYYVYYVIAKFDSIYGNVLETDFELMNCVS